DQCTTSLGAGEAGSQISAAGRGVMSTQAVADARLGLLYHSVWSKLAANDTFARWAREDFVNLAGVAEAIWAYDHSPGALEGGVDRVLGISQVLHTWA